MVRYPGRRTFPDLVASPGYLKVMPWKLPSLKVVVTPVSSELVIPDPRRDSRSPRPCQPAAGRLDPRCPARPGVLTRHSGRSASAGPGYATPAAVFGASAPAGVSARGMKMAATRPTRPMHARARMAYP